MPMLTTEDRRRRLVVLFAAGLAIGLVVWMLGS